MPENTPDRFPITPLAGEAAIGARGGGQPTRKGRSGLDRTAVDFERREARFAQKLPGGNGARAHGGSLEERWAGWP